MRSTLSCLAVFLLTTAGLRAGSIGTRVLWIEDKPHTEVTLDADLPGLKEIDVMRFDTPDACIVTPSSTSAATIFSQQSARA